MHFERDFALQDLNFNPVTLWHYIPSGNILTDDMFWGKITSDFWSKSGPDCSCEYSSKLLNAAVRCKFGSVCTRAKPGAGPAQVVVWTAPLIPSYGCWCSWFKTQKAELTQGLMKCEVPADWCGWVVTTVHSESRLRLSLVCLLQLAFLGKTTSMSHWKKNSLSGPELGTTIMCTFKTLFFIYIYIYSN